MDHNMYHSVVLSINGYLQLLTGVDGFGDREEDVLAVLVCHQVLLHEVLCGSHKHHPVALVLIRGLKVGQCAVTPVQLQQQESVSIQPDTHLNIHWLSPRLLIHRLYTCIWTTL